MNVDSCILNRELRDLDGEIWVDIPGYGSRYQVSNLGRVKSVIRGRVLILKKSVSNGRFQVGMYDNKGRYSAKLVGRLVAAGFISEPKEGYVVQYLDNNALNDRSDNIIWRTKSQSIRKTFQERGSINVGSKNGMVKLSEDKVREIRSLRKSGKTYKFLSDSYGVGISNIQQIVNGLIWKTA